MLSVGLALPFGREHRLFQPELRVHQCFQHARSRGQALELPTKDGFASRAKVAGRPRRSMESMLVVSDLDPSMLTC